MRPSGTVTFLFTDIEGSTRRWEADAEAMRTALVAHDEVMRSAVESHEGWLFKHTGDGVCAAFSTAGDAVAAAVDAQRRLGLPVRMGIATGEAESRGEDYFGPVLNRAARVMAAGHGGQILVAAATAALVTGAGLVDLGERRLADLSGAEHLYQVHADGLRSEFPPLRTLDAVPGNLPEKLTSLVGRDIAIKELCELVRAHRMATLTGVGGVGKTRLAVQVGAELIGEFPDGVWLIELAPVADPAAVADVVATTLGVTQQPGKSLAESVADALSGRRLLVIVDNCEHVLDAVPAVVEMILARTSTVKVLATSREGLRVEAEHLWPVPPLDVGGAGSSALEMFLERATAVNPGLSLDDETDVAAVGEICARLDGIPLAIELAAARTVSMTAKDVRDRLDDRFRLLSGRRRGTERHQTLRHAVAWSYDLLGQEERSVLQRCAVFAGGFDLAAATQLNDYLDDYDVLDILDSLVRKSLVVVDPAAGHARYGMLETIRQYAEEQLGSIGAIEAVRDRHAAYYAREAVAHWSIWDGPDQRVALDWVDAELANLRAAFRWAADRSDLVTAAAIASHAAMLGWALLRYEPVGWAEEILPAAIKADVAQLPRLYTAANLCSYIGRPEDALVYGQVAGALETDARYDSFPDGWCRLGEAFAHVFAGRFEEALAILEALVAQRGAGHMYGGSQAQVLAFLGRNDEALPIAVDALTTARASASPFVIAQALSAYGLAHMATDPVRALEIFRQGLAFARDQRLPFWERTFTRDAGRLEAVHGDIRQALTMHDSAIEAFHQAGDVFDLAVTLTNLASALHRLGRAEIAATIYGSSTRLAAVRGSLPDRLRAELGPSAYEHFSALGAAMQPAEAVGYAGTQIELARQELGPE